MNGSQMAGEMAEQPSVLRSLLRRRREIAAAISSVRAKELCGIVLIARGSSDHAALYGRYILELVARRPVSLAAPSLHTLYGADVDLSGYLAIAISQSGETPEVVTVLERMRASGARTVAVVNASGTPLTTAADSVIPLAAGDENAIPATKTFTATLLALVLVAGGLGAVPWSEGDLEAIPGAAESVLADESAVTPAAELVSSCEQALVVARGVLFSAATETALKLREGAGIAAEAYSTADLRHGPIVAVTPSVPVIAFSARGPTQRDVAEMVADLRERSVRVITIAADEDADITLPALTELLQPVAAAIRGQQLARRAALLRGCDPDAPAGLSKVTLTH